METNFETVATTPRIVTGQRRSRNDNGITDWKRAHEDLARIARIRSGLDAEEGECLLRALRSEAHLRLGYGSFAEYIERLFGYSPRFTLERLRVAEALQELPEIRTQLSDAKVSWSVARELTRVSTPKTESEWLRAAHGRTVREVERLVSGHRVGDVPGDPADPAARRHVLRLELSAEALATFREALAKLRRDVGTALDDDAAILLMARQVLRGPTDDGRASYQVALTVCENCKQGKQQGRGEMIDVGPEVVEMASCDGQTHVGTSRAKQTVPPTVRRRVLSRDGRCCVVPGCRHSTFIDVHHIDPRCEGGGHELDNLVCLCGAHHRALHRGELTIEGRVSTGLAFKHADGTPYGSAVSPKAADVRAMVFRALRDMGFKETEARGAVERAATHVGMGASAEVLLRRALVEATELVTR
jgi:HNH endonuclease